MELLRDNAKTVFDRIDSDPKEKEKKFAQKACQRLTIVTGCGSATAPDVVPEYSKLSEAQLTEKIGRGRISDAPRPVGAPSLELVFLPPPKKLSDDFPKPRGFSVQKDCFRALFEYLGLDYALLTYLTSSRSGWYCVRGPGGRHSFLYKDYMYTLAWTFNTKTAETRGMLAARSEFKSYSKLWERDEEGAKVAVDDTLKFPVLPKDLLGQPLALAFIALADCVTYLEQIIEKDGYGLGKIEGKTGYGLWVKPEGESEKEAGKESADDNLTELEKALRNIARLIGQFLTLFKSVEIAQSMANTIEQAIERPALWGAPERPEPNMEPWPWQEAVHLLRARIHSVDQSAKATMHRAKAMSNVVSGLISRLVARRAVADGSSMKVIALMTMFFLPATYISALWAVPALDKDDVLTKQSFGIYWVVTIPVTLVVFVAWYALNNDWRRLLERLPRLHGSLEQQGEPPGGRMQDRPGREPADEEMGLREKTSLRAWLSKPRNSNQSGKS